MRLLLLAYCLGILIASYLPSTALQFGKSGLLLCLGVLFVIVQLPASPRKTTAATIFVFIFAMSWHASWGEQQIASRLPLALEGVDISVQGYVLGLPERTDRGQRFEFEIVASQSDFVNRKVRLDYFGEEPINGGQDWEFTVRLKQARGLANRHGFDFEAWALQRGLTATGYVRPGSERLLDDRLSLRGKIFKRLGEELEQSEYKEIVLALTLGYRSAIDAGLWELFSKTGTNHLWVISGLHIGLIAGFVFFLIKLLFRVLPVLHLLLPMTGSSGALAMLAAAAYAYLAGFSLSTQRALIMLCVVLGAALWRRKIGWDCRWLLAMAMVLSLNPLAGQNPGFWFSFIAVAVLLFFSATTPLTKTHFVTSLLASQWQVWLGLILPLSFWLGQFSLVAPMVNLFAIPLVGMLVVPLSLLLIPVVFFDGQYALYISRFLDWLLAQLFSILNFITDSLFLDSSLQVAMDGLLVLLIASVGLLLLLLPMTKRLKVLSVPMLLAVFLPASDTLSDEEWTLTVFDVGQGLASLIETRNHLLLYDTGAGMDAQRNLANSSVIPYLRKRNLSRLDALVISHGDNDHSGGAAAIINELHVDQVFAGGSVERLARDQKSCQRPLRWQWDGVLFEFLNKPNAFNGENRNNGSCVLRISGAGRSALLPGDIETDAELELSALYGTSLASTILIAPHHGSKTSSSYALLKQVQPLMVVYSAGYKNQFGHPAIEVQEKYLRYGAKGYTTANLGMISFASRKDSDRIVVTSFRQQYPRYWRHQASPALADISNYSGRVRVW